MSFLKNKEILITCGPTWVPIDDTRIISNRSSGELGQRMATTMAKANAKVTLLEGPVAKRLETKFVRVQPFTFYDEFLKLLKKELTKNYDIVIHAAAVSDYKVKKPSPTKLSSQLKAFNLELVSTQKIIHLIKKLNPKTFLVGFKLESKITKALAIQESKNLFKKAHCDLVIANSSTNTKYNGYILDKESNFLAHETTRQGITDALIKILTTNYTHRVSADTRCV